VPDLRGFCRALSGLEPETPSLPWSFGGNRSQPAATVFPYLSRSRRRPTCSRLPPVAPAGLHKGSILSSPSWLHLAARSGLHPAGGPNSRGRDRAPTSVRLAVSCVRRASIDLDESKLVLAREVGADATVRPGERAAEEVRDSRAAFAPSSSSTSSDQRRRSRSRRWSPGSRASSRSWASPVGRFASLSAVCPGRRRSRSPPPEAPSS
jgi:hypothetical protein